MYVSSFEKKGTKEEEFGVSRFESALNILRDLFYIVVYCFYQTMTAENNSNKGDKNAFGLNFIYSSRNEQNINMNILL